MGDLLLAVVVLAILGGLTVWVNRIMGEMRRQGIPTGESLCGGNPNCPLRRLEEDQEQPSENKEGRPT